MKVFPVLDISSRSLESYKIKNKKTFDQLETSERQSRAVKKHSGIDILNIVDIKQHNTRNLPSEILIKENSYRDIDQELSQNTSDILA